MVMDLNKWTPALVGLLCSSSVFATNDPFSGIYAGANVGFIQSDVDNDYSTVVYFPGQLDLILTSEPGKLTQISAIGGLHLGYTARIENMFLIGLEARANFQDLNTHNTDRHY